MLAWLAIALGCVNKGEGEPTGWARLEQLRSRPYSANLMEREAPPTFGCRNDDGAKWWGHAASAPAT